MHDISWRYDSLSGIGGEIWREINKVVVKKRLFKNKHCAFIFHIRQGRNSEQKIVQGTQHNVEFIWQLLLFI